MLYDGHTVDEWASIGYDVEIYDAKSFPLKWDKAIKYGFCVKCGLIDDLDISLHISSEVCNNIVGICKICMKDVEI